ncbi:MAG: succinylglutamate desuccinylase [Xenococcaceae cyanobacterium]
MNPIIETIELLKLASGDILSLQVYKFIGSRSGKKAYIQANLPGAEIVGNVVIHQLIEYLKTLDESQVNGEIWLVPVCNPLGVNQRTHFFSTGRFNSYDGKDWNRIFWDYEKECQNLEVFAKDNLDNTPEKIRSDYLTQIQTAFQEQFKKIDRPSSVPYYQKYRYCLQSLCLDANYLIDIHSSSNQGINYLYCFPGREGSAQSFLLEYGILMNEYDGDAFDEAFMKPWLALEREFAKLNREIQFNVESWTLELGSGMQINPQSVEKGIVGIKNYLCDREILKLDRSFLINTNSPNTIFIEKKKIKNYYAPTGGIIQERISLNSQVRAGDKLYQILSFNKSCQLPEQIDIFAESNGIIFDVSTNYSVNQGEYVLGIFAFDS